jgi:hypothetical protein
MTKLNNKNDAHYTHEKYTSNELSQLGDNSFVLELGVGNGSSPLMYEFCKKNPNVTVLAFETDRSWFNQMFDKYGDLPNYVFNLIGDWADLSNHIDMEECDLVFVDQSPWEARISCIDLLKDKTKTFILHDYDYFNKIDSGFTTEECENIYINNETSWLGKKYLEEFFLEDNYDSLPPTLVMRKK